MGEHGEHRDANNEKAWRQGRCESPAQECEWRQGWRCYPGVRASQLGPYQPRKGQTWTLVADTDAAKAWDSL